MFSLPLSVLYLLTADSLVSGQSTITADGELLDSKQLVNTVGVKLDQQQRAIIQLFKRQEEQQQVSQTIHQQTDVIRNLTENLRLAKFLVTDQIRQAIDQQDIESRQWNQNVNLHNKIDQFVAVFNQSMARERAVSSHLNQTLNQQQQTLQRVIDLLQQIEIAGQCHEIRPTVQHATLRSVRQTVNGTVATFVCHLGYKFRNGLNMSSTTCNGHSWTFIDSSCSKLHCPRLTIPNAKLAAYKTSYQSEVNVTCESGYQASYKLSTAVLTCQADGNWSLPKTPICKSVQHLSPSLTHILPGNRSVYALASLNDRLFVLRYPSNGQLEVYHATNFQFVAIITIPGAGSYLFGVAPCPYPNNCLYVSDYYNHKVHTIHFSPTTPLSDTTTPSSSSATTTTTNSWPVGSNPLGLSVNRQHNVLVSYGWGQRPIDEYTPTGSHVRLISSHGNNVFHAVQHVNDTLAINLLGPVYGISLVSGDGRLLHTYGNTTGLVNHNPTTLAVETQGYVLAADQGNNRILLLNPTLSEARPLPLTINPSRPRGMWLEESNGRLYVGEGSSPYRIFAYDGIFNLPSAFRP